MGSPQVINCTAYAVGGVESSSVMISWMGPGRKSIVSDSRVTISPFVSGSTYTSSLQLAYIAKGDEGMYTCNVTILYDSVLQSVALTSKL